MKRLVTLAALAAVSFTMPAHAGPHGGKKVLFIDSYHEGYAWSDGITAGVKAVIGGSGAELKIHRMDTKRNGSADFAQKAGAEVKALIESFKPDVVIASDDNASKYVIVPYFKNAALPFVFDGLNWDASVYGFPVSNVTGMVEVSAVDELVAALKKSGAKGDRIGLIVGDSETERKEYAHVKKLLGVKFAEESYIKTYDEFKKAFVDLQGKVDMLVVGNMSSVQGWDEKTVAAFVEANTKIVTGTAEAWNGPFAMIAYGKVPEEQGEWAAQAALKILSGAKPSDIPVARNKKGRIVINARIAQKLNATIPTEIVEAADKIIE